MSVIVMLVLVINYYCANKPFFYLYIQCHDHELHGAELAKEGGACISIALAPCYIVQC